MKAPWAASALGAAAAVIGGAAITGWQSGIEALRSVVPGQVAMNPSSALGFLLAGSSIGLAHGPRIARTWARGAAATVALIGLARLGEYLSFWRLGIDSWFFREEVAATGQAEMAPMTAIDFTLVGVAILLLAHADGRRRLAAQLLLVTSGLGALSALVGHLFGVAALHGPMALNTAVGFLLLTAGGLVLTPETGVVAAMSSPGPGASLARRLVPAVVAVSLALGWLQLVGQRRGLYAAEAGIPIFVVAIIVVLAGIVLSAARSLDQADSRRLDAVRELRRSEERYRLLFDANPVATWVYDRESLEFLAVNDTAVAGYGYSRSEFLAMTIKDIRPPQDVPALLEAVANGVPSQVLGRTWRHRKKDGSLIDVEITSLALTFGGRPADLVLARDVTERRRTMMALEESEERFRAVATTANDAIISADARGVVTFLNPAAEALFGYPPGELIGRPVTELIPERLRDAHRRGLARVVATGAGRLLGDTVEFAGLRADGGEFPIEISLASWRSGAETAFTAILRDITERKRTEDELRRYATELEVANRELDAFCYSVSHDLRAPLRSIDGFSQAVVEDCGERLGEDGRGHLARVRAAAQRMAGLIDDLLDLSRVSRAEMRRESLDLSALAEEMLEELRRRDPDRRVDTVIAPGLQVEGDPRLLRVMLGNLLENAWKYTRLKPRARIEVGRTESDGEEPLFVRDDGIGFEMAYAGKLFAPFQRLHGAAEFEGTGIGLATVQRIVNRHGGRVWAEGEVGRGATFFLTL